jgi:hypothetical protein
LRAIDWVSTLESSPDHRFLDPEHGGAGFLC